MDLPAASTWSPEHTDHPASIDVTPARASYRNSTTMCGEWAAVVSAPTMSDRVCGVFELDRNLFAVTEARWARPDVAVCVWLNDPDGPFVGMVSRLDSNCPSASFRDWYLTRDDVWRDAVRDKAVEMYFEWFADRVLGPVKTVPSC